MRAESTHHQGILYVAPGDPWNPWTNSGFVRRTCEELQARGLLRGATWNGMWSQAELQGPTWLGRLRRVLRNRAPSLFSAAPWLREGDGSIGRVLKTLPAGAPVIYHYVRPELDLSLPLRRFLFLDMTVRDAVRTNSYSFSGLSEQQIRTNIEAHRRILEHVEGVLTFSTYAARSIAQEYGYPPEQIVAVGSGPVRPLATAPAFQLSRYERANILFVGRKFERKGGPLLLEAFRIVRERLPKATLTIIGPPQPGPAQPGVEYKGLVRDDELKRSFANASVFCMPAVFETWGLVYGEAAYAGLPIVGLNRWALPDIVLDRRSGRLTDDDSPAGLAAALIDVLSDPARMLAMGREAHRHATEALGWKAVVDRLLGLVEPGALKGSMPRSLASYSEAAS